MFQGNEPAVGGRMQGICFNPQNGGIRWLAYFDLLGTTDMIKSGKTHKVFSAYRTASEKLDGWKQRHPQISQCWFSDTFLLYSEDGTAESFAAIEMVSRWFVFALLREKIPVRGSLAIGDFYADPENGIYLGEALVEAHDWGENQDWIGYILTPSATSRLEVLNLPVNERLNYRKYEVPLKKPHPQSEDVAACVVGNWALLSGVRNPLIERLREMLKQQHDDRIVQKYLRTIAFLEKHQRMSTANNGVVSYAANDAASHTP